MQADRSDRHVDPVDLIDYARGRLARSRATAVREHCRDCAPCGDQLAAVVLLRRGQAGDGSRRALRPVAAVAAIVVLVAGVAAWQLLFSPGSSQPLPLAVSDGSGGPAVAGAEDPSGMWADGSPLADPEFRRRARRLLGALLTLRQPDAVPATVSGEVVDLKAVGDAVAAGRYDDAAASLRASQLEARTRASFLGVVLALAGRRDEARAPLARVVDEPPSTSEQAAAWLVHAELLLAEGRTEQARERLLSLLEAEPSSDVFVATARERLASLSDPSGSK